MSTLIFLGPSLAAEAASELLPAATIRGPAACGDVYLAVREGFRSIAIIDGYFEHRPSVWHKELLWALHSGVRVYGAASMGALRAAELEPFGMIGVGHIYEQYRDGELIDDDEVAVAHEDAERGYRAVSEAMVNIRATLARAVSLGTLGGGESESLAALAKSQFYAERSYAALRFGASGQGLGPDQLAAFWSWLAEEGGVNQKRDDARALLVRIAGDQRAPASAPPPAPLPALFPALPPALEFEYTDAWHAFKQRMDARFDARAGLDHVDMDPALRALALQLARFEGSRPTAEEVQAHSEVLRRRLGLLTPAAAAAWLAHHQLDLPAFSRLVYEDWLAERYRDQATALSSAQAPVIALLSGPSGAVPR